jgi:arginine decarboxylase
MDTPIFDFVQEYIRRDMSRLHMPGHKGRAFLGCEEKDLTEICGADSLYAAAGIIRRSEENAARLFGTRHSFYATGGASQCVQAMLYLAWSNAAPGSRPVVLAARNVHSSFLRACAMLDAEVSWLYPGGSPHPSVCSCPVTPAALEAALDAMAEPPFAAYVTSPDYLGFQLDLAALSACCRRRGIPLLVDNAHGAYLKFLPESAHPMDLGAALCCDSAHKTLPVLTGGAYLHIAADAPADYEEGARRALSLFGSTSPSYLILQSLDLCNRYLAEDYRERLAACARQVGQLRAELRASGLVPCETEPLKITIDAKASGTTGRAVAERLRAHRVECEYADGAYAVLMFTPENREEDFQRIREALRKPLQSGPEPPPAFAPPPPSAQVLSIREALLGRHETVPAARSAGRICGTPAVSCPPAVPLCVCGERITPDTVALFKEYGIDRVEVVRE